MSESATIQISAADIMRRLESLEPTRKTRIMRKIVSAALGAIPWLGGFISAQMAFTDEAGQLEVNSLNKEWISEHERKLSQLGLDLAALIKRLDELGEDITERLESEAYLGLIRKAFRVYDQADTDLKRSHVCRLLGNAAATKLSDDDLIRLYIDWLERYHEAHFAVIREVFTHPGSTRADIWERVNGNFPTEDSMEADLYRLLIHDLSTGRIVRQHRETNDHGEFYKKQRTKRPAGTGSKTMKSAFDDEESYELTELGKQFVHYVFNEIVERIPSNTDG